jgi:hypothetical protein
MTRIEEMSNPERTLVNLLTPLERKEALVRAAQVKARNADRGLMAAYLNRIRSGEIAPQTLVEDTGKPYPTNGRTWYYQNEQEPLTDLGRVPGYEDMHVLRKPDGTLVFAGGFNLREEGEAWEQDDLDR